VAGDAEVSGDANSSEMAQEADNDADEPPPLVTLAAALQSALCGLIWRQLAASPMSIHAAGLAMLKSMLRL